MLYSSSSRVKVVRQSRNESKREMSDFIEDEKLHFYGDEDGRGAWWNRPDFESEYEIGIEIKIFDKVWEMPLSARVTLLQGW
jgi:hypothetical protein